MLQRAILSTSLSESTQSVSCDVCPAVIQKKAYEEKYSHRFWSFLEQLNGDMLKQLRPGKADAMKNTPTAPINCSSQ
ncbi:hypothetical protein Q8A67_020286 [Cirrhinus molitorella]|uniref:Uncharacterized protein n=1 Tax=Cirrhinus molitorella TaxID=172907 RepID=A0AA88PJ97_9TELE|nr:hypothetical protein Q8A67_020286 [Cirrhinus molitorella]